MHITDCSRTETFFQRFFHCGGYTVGLDHSEIAVYFYMYIDYQPVAVMSGPKIMKIFYKVLMKL